MNGVGRARLAVPLGYFSRAAVGSKLMRLRGRCNLPGEPNIVEAYAHSARWVIIRWDAIVSEGRFDIAVWREPEYASPFPRGWLSETTFTDQAAQPDTEYSYRVCVIYEGDPKSYCSPTKVKTPPEGASTPSRPTPSIIGLEASPRSITVRWD